jgi:hypothetical protein
VLANACTASYCLRPSCSFTNSVLVSFVLCCYALTADIGFINTGVLLDQYYSLED